MREIESIPTKGPNCDERNNNMSASRSNNYYFLNIIVQNQLIYMYK